MNRLKQIFNRYIVISLVFLITFGLNEITLAATKLNLGVASSYGILAGSTITNTGSSVVNGNIGLSPGTSVIGFPPGTMNGVLHVADTNAIQAKTALTSAYNNAVGQTPVTTVPTELGGTTKVAGIYTSSSGTFGINGTLTLDAKGDPNAVFIFKSSSTLIAAGSSRVVLRNSAQACNVFWIVGSSATLGSSSSLRGNIIAQTSITLNTGASVQGRVMAINGAVTLDTNRITTANCLVAPSPTNTPTPTSITPQPTNTVAPTPTGSNIPTGVPIQTGTPSTNPTNSAPTVTPTTLPVATKSLPAIIPQKVLRLPNTDGGENKIYWWNIVLFGLGCVSTVSLLGSLIKRKKQ